jgi:hypothetical protein
VLCLPIACLSGLAKAEPNLAEANAMSIKWSVEDRFRLFNGAEDQAKKRIEALLHNMQSSSDGLILQASKRSEDTPIFTEHYEKILEALIKQNGSSLRNSNWAWAADTKNPDKRVYAQDYVLPKTYKIKVALVNSTASPNQKCIWTVSGEGQTQTPKNKPCDQEFPLELARHVKGKKFGVEGVSVTVALENGPILAQTDVAFEDKLIVAMGDSFIAGEGNPDVPSVLEQPEPLKKFQKSSWPNTIPKGTFKHAEWWDEPCHRSLLSWPVMAGLYEAAQNEQKAITLVHVGCSGATIPDLTKRPQKDLPGGGKETENQIQQVRKLLNNERAIDQIYLSISGNDAEFANVIATMVLPPNDYLSGSLDLIAPKIVALIGEAVSPYNRVGRPLGNLSVPFRKSAEAHLKDNLEDEFIELQNQLSSINGHTNDGSDKPVAPPIIFQPEYPSILQVKAGDRMFACRSILTEVDFEEYDPSRKDDKDRDREFKNAMNLVLSESNGNQQGSNELAKFKDERAGFEALNGIIFYPFRRQNPEGWNFQFKYNPKERGAYKPEGTDLQNWCGPTNTAHNLPESGDSEVCMAHWVWSRLNEVVRLRHNPSGIGTDLRWTVFNGHVEKTKPHGWCGRDDRSPLALPVTIRDGAKGWKWKDNLKPTDFDPYRKDLPRWFRTANDSALGQYGGVDRFFQGSIHPTFHAHLAIAEAALEESKVIQAKSPAPIKP